MSDVVGTSGPDTLSGTAGAEKLQGLDGDDVILAGGGPDTIDGGAGVDTLSYENATSAITASLFPSATGPQVSNVERLIGGAFDDRLGGDGGDNILRGGLGADALEGGFGSDTLDGGAGNDDISGGVGDDEVRGGSGVDTLRGGDGADRFIFDLGDATAGTPDIIVDWSSADQLSLPALGDYQEASAPDAGRSYADSLVAAGARIVAMQTPNGVIVYMDAANNGGTAEGAILLSGRTLDDISGANVGALTTRPTAPMGGPETGTAPGPTSPLASSGADTLSGGADADSLAGLSGADSLSGGAGADTLDGGPGIDTLNGGAGADRFIIGVGESGTVEGRIDVIDRFQSTDLLVFGNGRLTDSLIEISGPQTYASALALANSRIASGEVNFVTIRVGYDTFVFVDSRNDDGEADDAVKLVDPEYSFLTSANLVAVTQVVEPTAPRQPGIQQSMVRATITGNMDTAHLTGVLNAVIQTADDGQFFASDANSHINVTGQGFTYNGAQFTGGVMSRVDFATPGFQFTVQLINGQSPVPLAGWLVNDATTEAFSSLLRSSDAISGAGGVDLLRGYEGNDFIEGQGGSDTIFGGPGSDTVFATHSSVQGPGAGAGPAGSTYLRGDDGNDMIFGAAGFDDINGNMGNDTAEGGSGDDWVVGGKDNDALFGEAGSDLVYGNLGSDTCVGGDGNDIVRGGQDNDAVYGGAGDDYVSGDKGDDTVAGGAGADLFHTFGDAGIDRVTDFSLAQGDRVLLDPGTQYTVAQSGADTVISMTGGGQMILVGVQTSALTTGWIFGA